MRFIYNQIIEPSFANSKDYREFRRLAALDGCATTTGDGRYRVVKPSRMAQLWATFDGATLT